jgi:sulfate/thiosulfate transport system ATP-binding protein
MSVEVRNISKRFEADVAALDQVSLKIESGELVALLGPSGSGKTTLLRIIGGLEFPDNHDAKVLFHDKDVTRLAAHKRKAGFAFQHYALFRHLNVFENIAFGLRVRPFWRRPKDSEIRERVERFLKLVQLDPLAQRFPSQLSGGQRQRVALARALAVEPKVLLLDEPFGALDAKVRKELRQWLRKLHEEIHITTLFVTHDQEEALDVAGRVAILREGKIEQIGTPREVYDHPATPFVYEFLGNVNAFKGHVHNGNMQIGQGKFAAPKNVGDGTSPATAFVRSHDIRVALQPSSPAAFPAKLVRFHIVGPVARLELERLESGESFTAHLSKEDFEKQHLEPGAKVYVELQNVKIFPEDYSI